MKELAKVAIKAAINSLPDRVKSATRNALTVPPPDPVAAVIAEALTLDYARAESLLTRTLKETASERLWPHLARIRFLRARQTDPVTATTEMLATIAGMEAEIRRQPIYVPGEFWAGWGQFNVNLLTTYGISNFKRTVAHNYQNWLMVEADDPQVRQLHRLWDGNAQPWANLMEAPDHVGSNGDTLERSIEYPLADPAKRDIYRVAIGLLWEYVLAQDATLGGLEESTIGNPIRIYRQGRLISSDLAHSLRERNLLLNACNLTGNESLTVCELGAGHGRLAEIFALTTNYRYCIFDITPALYVSQWYIERRFPDEKVFRFRPFERFEDIQAELSASRFAFFTPNQIETLPDDCFDLFVNMNSLMEMRAEQVRNFLYHIDRLTTRAFLSRQWNHWRNDPDDVTVSKEDFRLPARWRLALDRVDDIHPEMFNHVWVTAKS